MNVLWIIPFSNLPYLTYRCNSFAKKHIQFQFQFRFQYISIALKLAYNRNKLFKISHYRSRDMLNFDYLDKVLGIVSPAHFVYDFSTKCSCYILLTDQISLPGCLYFLQYWAICVLQLFVTRL